MPYDSGELCGGENAQNRYHRVEAEARRLSRTLLMHASSIEGTCEILLLDVVYNYPLCRGWSNRRRPLRAGSVISRQSQHPWDFLICRLAKEEESQPSVVGLFWLPVHHYVDDLCTGVQLRHV